MATTYESIASLNINGSSSVQFSSIPATYTDLKIVLFGAINSPGINTILQVNGITGTFYSNRFLSTAGSATPYSDYNNSTSNVPLTPTGDSGFQSYYGVIEIDILGYFKNNHYKPIISRSYQALSGTKTGNLTAGLIRVAPTINSITITPQTTYFVNTSTACLYGIKAD